MPVLLLFVALPLIEIALFIAVGGQIGMLTTLLLIVLGALAGVAILRGQRARALALMQSGLRVDAGAFLAQGTFRVVAGLLLILPGFLTDTIALVLLIPAVQRALVRSLGSRVGVASVHTQPADEIIEAEFEVRESHHGPRGRPQHPDRRIDDNRRH